MPEIDNEFLLKESIAVSNEPTSIQNIRDKYSEEVKHLIFSDQHILTAHRKRMDHTLTISSSLHSKKSQSNKVAQYHIKNDNSDISSDDSDSRHSEMCKHLKTPEIVIPSSDSECSLYSTDSMASEYNIGNANELINIPTTY